jgi:hypothetical protein
MGAIPDESKNCRYVNEDRRTADAKRKLKGALSGHPSMSQYAAKRWINETRRALGIDAGRRQVSFSVVVAHIHRHVCGALSACTCAILTRADADQGDVLANFEPSFHNRDRVRGNSICELKTF